MTRLFMGWKSGVGSVLKVMANDTDDPLTTPNTDYAKFRFNSETGKIGYIYDTFLRSYPSDTTYPPAASSGSAVNNYVVSGSGFPAGSELLSSKGANRFLGINLSSFNLGYTPIFEIKVKLPSGRFTKQLDSYSEASGFAIGSYYWYGFMSFTHSLGGAYKIHREFPSGLLTQNFNTVRYFRATSFTSNAMYIDYFEANNTSDYWGTTSDRFGFMQWSSSGTSNQILGIVWDLPAGNVPLQAPASPTSGQKMIVMSPSTVKVSLPGYDVDTATRQQMVLDSTRVPAKIIKCGEISIAGNGSTTVATDAAFPLTGNVYVDYIQWETGYPLYIPSYRPHAISNWSNSEIVIEYAVSTNSVTFYNMRPAAINMRYMIIGDDDAAQSSGGGKVLETGAGYQRILRPGANSASPAWSDILLDTRLPYLPILADGYEAVSGFSTNTTNPTYLGSLMKSVSFSNGGLKPFPKISVEYDDGSFDHPYVLLSLSNQGTPPSAKMLKQSAFCEMTDTSITFRCNPSGLSSFSFNPAGSGSWTSLSHSWNTSHDTRAAAKPVGFRYYILGLPI